MLNIYDVRAGFFNEDNTINKDDYIIVSIYYGRFFECKTTVKPFIEAMKNANSIKLFLDENDNITNGQIGKYSYDEGLYILSLICENGEYITKKENTKNNINLLCNTGNF